MHEPAPRVGRPRSEGARLAVLRAADDMLVAEGYAAMTMKGIAERAKVGRQTVYRWWSSKAEILLEASAADSVRELTVEPSDDPETEITRFLSALAEFLTRSDAGLAYRALLGEAQHDREVAAMLREADILGQAAGRVLDRTHAQDEDTRSRESLTAALIGPLLYRILTEEWSPSEPELRALAQAFLGE